MALIKLLATFAVRKIEPIRSHLNQTSEPNQSQPNQLILNKMKKLMLSMLLLLAAASVSAQKYTVDFYADGAGGNLRKVYLMNAETNALIDSFVVDHERAHMEGTLEGLPVLVVVAEAPNARMSYATFILDTTPTSIKREMPSQTNPYATVTIKGSQENNRLNEVVNNFNNQVKQINQLVAELRASLPEGAQPTEEQIKALTEKATAYEEAIKTGFEQALQTERNNKVSLYCLTEGASFLDIDYIAKYLEGYPLADSPALRRLRADIESKQLRAVGAPMIDFEMADQAGTMHKLSDFVGKGKYVMVDFWASWCSPCRQEMPNVKAAYERFHDKGFDIVAVSFDGNREAWLKGIADLGMTWKQLSDLQGWNCAAGQLYKIHAIPCTIIFGPDGKVAAADLRGDALGKFLEEKLK